MNHSHSTYAACHLLIQSECLRAHRWTEPIILCLIVANVVVLTFQGARSLDTAPDLREDGFFRTWEDYALFVLFILFTYVTPPLCSFSLNRAELI